MAFVDISCEFKPESGKVVNEGEIVSVSMHIRNNLPWALTNVRFKLKKVTGEVHLAPTGSQSTLEIVGADILPGKSAVQHFVLKAEIQGEATAELELVCDVANTGLRFPNSLTGSVSFPVYLS